VPLGAVPRGALDGRRGGRTGGPEGEKAAHGLTRPRGLPGDPGDLRVSEPGEVSSPGARG